MRIIQWSLGVWLGAIGLGFLLWPGSWSLGRAVVAALNLGLAVQFLRAARVCVRISGQQVLVRNRWRTYRLALNKVEGFRGPDNALLIGWIARLDLRNGRSVFARAMTPSFGSSVEQVQGKILDANLALGKARREGGSGNIVISPAGDGPSSA